jgi:solute carrier family 32 (vesicular inhibitory amino acid transporter)
MPPIQVGDLAGGGIVALPTAVVQAGFVTGMILTVVMTLAVTYTSYVLGKCWVILQNLWPEYTSSHCRKPYPQMGYRALGPRWGQAVSVCIDITQFGIAVVYLLLVSKNIHDFLKAFFNTELGFCVIVIIVALCLLPVMFLKSPQDFW